MIYPYTFVVNINGLVEMVKFSRINIENEGLHKFYSPNEVKIIQLLWQRGNMTSSEINECFDDLTLPCVAGTLDRLVKSGVAEREPVKNGTRTRYVYSPAYSKDEMGVRISERIIDRLIETFGDSVTNTLGKYSKRKKE